MSEKMTTANSAEQESIDIDFAECAVPKWSRRRFLTMFMIMLGFTFFSASMWVGQEMAAGLDFWGFIKALLLGGAILGVYTGLLGYVGAETGLSLDLLSKRAFGEKGSYISSALTSFTQIGWFGVGIAMFAIPVARELFGGSTAVEWVLILIAGACMTASAYFGIKSLTIISYIAVPLVAVLGTVAMIMAVRQGDGTIIDQFAVSSGSLSVIGGAGLAIGSFVSGGTATPNFTRFAKNGKQGTIATVVAFFIGNSLMFFFGAISYIFVGGNDIFEVMIRLNLFYLAILVLGLNIWTTNDNWQCLSDELLFSLLFCVSFLLPASVFRNSFSQSLLLWLRSFLQMFRSSLLRLPQKLHCQSGFRLIFAAFSSETYSIASGM